VKYKVAIEQDGDGFCISVPGLPGCWSQGATEKEAIKNIRIAIKEYVRDELIGHAEVREIEVRA